MVMPFPQRSSLNINYVKPWRISLRLFVIRNPHRDMHEKKRKKAKKDLKLLRICVLLRKIIAPFLFPLFPFMSTLSLKPLLLTTAVGLFALGAVLSQNSLKIPTSPATHEPSLTEIYLGNSLASGQVLRLGTNKEVVIPEGLIAGQALGNDVNTIGAGILNATIG